MPTGNWRFNETQIALTSKVFCFLKTPQQVRDFKPHSMAIYSMQLLIKPFFKNHSTKLCWKLGLFPRHNRFPKHVTVSVWLPVKTIVSSQTVKTWIKITWWEFIEHLASPLCTDKTLPVVCQLGSTFTCARTGSKELNSLSGRWQHFWSTTLKSQNVKHILLHYSEVVMSWCWIFFITIPHLYIFLMHLGKTCWIFFS